MHSIRRSKTAVRTAAVLAAAALATTAALAQTASAHDHGGVRLNAHGFTIGVNKATGGSTNVTLDSGFASALAGLGVSAAPVSPASSPSAGVLSFPITGGAVVYVQRKHHGSPVEKAVAGWLRHSGGLTLTKGSTSVALTDLRINLSGGREGAIAGRVNGAGHEMRLFRMVDPKLNATDKSISASLVLSRPAADALNAAFGTTALTPHTVVGTVVIAPTFA
jgi:hypothetical protein